MEGGNPLPELSMRNVFQNLVRDLRFECPQLCQRREALENTDEKPRIAPFGDAEEFGDLNVGCDSVWFIACVHVPIVHFSLVEEPNDSKGTLLTGFPPPFRDERRGVEAGGWEVVDDLVDDLLGKRIHDARRVGM